MCEIESRLQCAHEWMHKCALAFEQLDWDQVKKLTQQILDLINASTAANGIKLVALAEMTMLGADTMQEDFEHGPPVLSRAIH